MFQAMKNNLLQVRHTSKELLTFLSTSSSNSQACRDPKVTPKNFSRLATKDVLTWLDHSENVSNYHQPSYTAMVPEVCTLLENVAATCFTQHIDDRKRLVSPQAIANLEKFPSKHDANNTPTTTK